MCTWSGKTFELLQAVTYSMLVSCIVYTVQFTKQPVVSKTVHHNDQLREDVFAQAQLIAKMLHGHTATT
jgi:hypothetical protein